MFPFAETLLTTASGFALVVCWHTQAASFARAAALPEGGTLRAVLGLVCGAKEFERAAPLQRNQKRFLNEVRHGRGRFTTRKKDRVGTAADKARGRGTIAAQRLLLHSSNAHFLPTSSNCFCDR